MLNFKLAHAVSLIITGSAFSLAFTSESSQAATVSYNAFNHDRSAPHALVSGGLGTDGWMRTSANDCGAAGSTCGNGPRTANNPNKVIAVDGNAAVPWVGNDPRNDTQFSYTGTQHLNWTAVINSGESATVSRLDSNTRYQGTQLSDGTIFNYADIDTAKGAWHDGIANGWKHDSDIGLFKSTVTQPVTLSITSLLGNGQTNETLNYGFSIFEGMDTSTVNFSHHGPWHIMEAIEAVNVGNNNYPVTEANPFNRSGLEILIGDYVLGNTATFIAEKDKVYTIILGGFQGGSFVETRNDYQLTISSVPVPGAVWLFGSGLVGLVTSRRRKNTMI